MISHDSTNLATRIPHPRETYNIFQNSNRNKKIGEVETYENITGLKSISEKVLQDLKENDTIHIIGAGQEYIKQTKGFFTKWQKDRINKKIKRAINLKR